MFLEGFQGVERRVHHELVGQPRRHAAAWFGVHLVGDFGEVVALGYQCPGAFDLGNPHLVLLVERPEDIDLGAAGALHEAAYDGGMNVHFVAPMADVPDSMAMRVWERGAGITEACGTGATAVARAAHDWGLVGEQVTVSMPGGSVQVLVGDPMILRGPSVFIAGIVVPQ